MISTGMFSGFVDNLFIAQHALIKLVGSDISQGREALHFTYMVPSLNGRWTINWAGNTGNLGEMGEFWVDAQDFHLTSLKVIAKDIPPQMLLRSLTLDLRYELVKAKTTPSLVPVSGDLKAIDIDGKLFRNTIAFSHCHVFEAESRMTTDDAENDSRFEPVQTTNGLTAARSHFAHRAECGC